MLQLRKADLRGRDTPPTHHYTAQLVLSGAKTGARPPRLEQALPLTASWPLGLSPDSDRSSRESISSEKCRGLSMWKSMLFMGKVRKEEHSEVDKRKNYKCERVWSQK